MSGIEDDRTDGAVDPVRTLRRLLPADLAAALRAARERLGLSVRDAALLAGVSPSYLRTLERGRACPSIPVACELAVALSLGPELTERLMRAAVPDAGRAHPSRRDRPDPSRPARHQVSRLVALAAGVDVDAESVTHELAPPMSGEPHPPTRGIH